MDIIVADKAINDTYFNVILKDRIIKMIFIVQWIKSKEDNIEFKIVNNNIIFINKVFNSDQELIASINQFLQIYGVKIDSIYSKQKDELYTMNFDFLNDIKRDQIQSLIDSKCKDVIKPYKYNINF